MNAELFAERTFCKIFVPVWIERICLRPDFQVPPDFGVAGINQLQPNEFPLRRPFSGIRRKRPLARADGVEVTILYPSPRFFWMSASGPQPEPAPNLEVHPLERLCRHDVPMVVDPAPDDRVELTYQAFLTGGFVRIYDAPDFLQERVRVLLRRLDEQRAVEFAEMLSEEVEPLVNMRDAGFLWRELQAPFAQKLLDEGTDFLFQHVLGRAGDDEVIRIPNEVDFGIDGSPRDRLPVEGLVEEFFQSIQNQVRQRGRDDAALRRARLGGEQGSIFDVASTQPFLKHRRIRGDVLEHPVVTDVIEATLDVAFQHPLRRRALAQCFEALLNGVRGGAFRSEAVGVFVRRGFRNWFQRLQMHCVHGAVFHRRNAQWPQLSFGFWDIDPPQGLRSVSPTLQRFDGFGFGRRSAPYFPVHSGRVLALIFRHSFHGQGFGREGVGEQPLQSFHFAPTTRPCCLDDACLQPSDLTSASVPIELFPMRRVVGGGTHG